MAIVFTKPLPTAQLIRAAVNTPVQFNSDAGGTPFKATITVNGVPFEITPRAGQFYFNFREVFKNLFSNPFVDAEQVTLNSGDLTSYVTDMGVILLAVEVVFQVSFVGGNVDSTQVDVSVIQATADYLAFKENTIDLDEPFQLLAPYVPGSNREYRARYFEGYPFDLQAYLATPGPVEVKNLTTAATTTFDFAYSISRWWLSDGFRDVNQGDVFTLVTGRNVIEFTNSQSTRLILDVIDGCGEYLKWKNREGGWSYWLFQAPYTAEREVDDLGYVNNDFADLDNPEVLRNIGKNSRERLTLKDVNVPPEWRDHVMGILESPKVYLFTGEKNAANFENDWQAVKVITSGGMSRTWLQRHGDFELVIEPPARNTLTL